MLKGGSLSPDVIQGLLKKSYEKKPSSFNDYQIDKSLSGERVQVYYNPALRQAVVVHRGSAGAKDWLVNDAGLMVGYRGNRFSHAQDIQNKAEKKYGAKNVTTLGHSLGAKVAEEVGQNSKEIITLNKPTVDMKPVSSKQYDIRTGSDLVSGFSGIATSNNKTTIPSGYRDPYSEHSPDVLSRLENKPIGRGRRLKGGMVQEEEEEDEEARREFAERINANVSTILESPEYSRDTKAHLLGKMLKITAGHPTDGQGIEEDFPDQMKLIRSAIDSVIPAADPAIRIKNALFVAKSTTESGDTAESPEVIDYLTALKTRVDKYMTTIGNTVSSQSTREDKLKLLWKIRQAIFKDASVDKEYKGLFDKYIVDVIDEVASPEGGGRRGMKGGIRPRAPPAPAQMLPQFITRYEAIQNVTDIRVRHDRIDELLQAVSGYIDTLPANEPLLDDFNDLLDEIQEEFIWLGEEIDQQQGVISIQNPANMNGGGSCFSRGQIYPDEEEESDEEVVEEGKDDPDVVAQILAEAAAPLTEYMGLNFDTDTESDAEGGGQGDSRVVPVTYIENELNAPVDVLDNPLPNIEPTQKPIDTYRQIQALKIMEEKKLADLEEKYFDWKAAAEEEGYDDEPYNNSEADETHMIEQMNQAQGMLDYYTQTEEQLRREMGIEQASGAGRFDGYSRCHDCGCDSYRDFNALHAK